ncbi:MAG TPA: hypothetical protein PKJ94_01145 [Ferruginibacter sp.]|nr:hypothetical protein [Ferruginibacter sp.]
MNIDRHNYETFFLLYVDKELSAADRKAVELFVQENPDLQMELSLLQDTVLNADDVVLEKKDWLYMEDGISALQENLLLYADDELSAADKKTVEALLATDKSAAAEWNSLRQAKLEPETSIVFADKRSLYRTEATRVVGMKWWRVAAAAILLGFGLWTGVTVYNNSAKTTTATEGGLVKGNSNPAKGNKGPVEIKNDSGADPAEIKPLQGNADQSQGIATIEAPGRNTKEQPGESLNRAGKKNTVQNQDNNRQENNIATQGNKEKPSNNLPKSYLENINRNERNEYAVTDVKPETNSINTSGVKDIVVKTNPVITDPAITAAIPVVYTDEKNNNDRLLYMDEDKVKRTKLGGFIRKATRMLSRNANIKTGDGLKVAGFEIALK